MLLDHVRDFCLEHSLFVPSSNVVVAVSGGPDSLALLHLLIGLSGDLKIIPVAATLDHQIRGAASKADADFVREIGGQWGVRVISESVDVPGLAKNKGLGIEAAARLARYSFLAKVAREVEAKVIATGHSQDDQAETVLMHVIRGSGLAGLRGMLPKTSLREVIGGLDEYPACDVVRPLLDTSRSQIDAYLHDLGVTPRFDATNEDMHYTRNRLRHEIMPLLEAINPQVKASLARTARSARDDYERLQSGLPRLTQHNNALWLDTQAFFALSLAEQRAVVRQAVWILSPQTDLNFAHTESAVQFIRRRPGSLGIAGSISVQVDHHRVSFYHRGYPPDCPYIESGGSVPAFCVTPGRFVLPGGRWAVTIERSADSRGLPAALETSLSVPLTAMIEIRARHSGDRFRPEGSGGHSQKLSDTFINMKIPAEWRDHVPLIVVDGEIACFVAPLLDGPRLRRSQTFVPGLAGGVDMQPDWSFSFCPLPLETGDLHA